MPSINPYKLKASNARQNSKLFEILDPTSKIDLNARTNYLIPTIPLFVNKVSQASLYLHDYLSTLCWGAVSVDPSAVAVGFNTHSYLMPVA